MSKRENVPPQNLKKFLFDVHNFDEPDKPDVEEAPPPPVFSEDELNAARRESHMQGKKDGHAEAQASFEKQVMDMLGNIREQFKILFDEEDRRNRLFEKESVQLACTMFMKAFPSLNERHGMDEVRAVIEKVLETAREQPEILIEVPAPYVEIIQKHIDTLLHVDGRHCIVRGNDNLPAGHCRMAWTNGNAARNAAHIASQIQAQVEQVLADKAILTDNNESATHPMIPVGEAIDNGERNE